EHPRLHIPVYSLYGEHREPIAEMLKDLDVLLVDLQDVGTRYYTFIWTMYLCMSACEKARVQVVVLDRPNPINGVTIEGPVLDPNYKSFVGLHPIPVRHGKTVAELAQQFRDEVFPDCGLSILPMKNWKRQMWFDQTAFQPFQTGVEIIRALRKLYPKEFAWNQPPYEYEWKRLPIEVLIGGPIESLFGD